MSKILITGGTGYIGSHTVVELQNEGYEVVIIDNLSNSRMEVLDGIEKITGIRPKFELLDLCDYEKLKDFLKKHDDISGVIHFAACKAISESLENPFKYYRNNLFSLINLLDIMKDQNIENFIFSSTAAVYGKPAKLPVTEDMEIKEANSPYGNTKKISEEIVRDAVASHNFKAVSLRYFNVIGAHQSALIGELPCKRPENLVPFIMQAAMGIQKELKVFGNDYNTPDGTCIRDYIHVVDLARAHVSALKRLKKRMFNENFEVFNLGTGRGASVMEVIKSFEKVSGSKLKYRIADRRPGDLENVYADVSLANRELNWRAEKTLDDSISSAWKWSKNIMQ